MKFLTIFALLLSINGFSQEKESEEAERIFEEALKKEWQCAHTKLRKDEEGLFEIIGIEKKSLFLDFEEFDGDYVIFNEIIGEDVAALVRMSKVPLFMGFLKKFLEVREELKKEESLIIRKMKYKSLKTLYDLLVKKLRDLKVLKDQSHNYLWAADNYNNITFKLGIIKSFEHFKYFSLYHKNIKNYGELTLDTESGRLISTGQYNNISSNEEEYLKVVLDSNGILDSEFRGAPVTRDWLKLKKVRAELKACEMHPIYGGYLDDSSKRDWASEKERSKKTVPKRSKKRKVTSK